MVGRIGRKAQFARIRAHGTTVREGRVRIRWCSPSRGSEEGEPAVAWSIGRNLGGAVQRNRVRRRLREVFRAAELEQRLGDRWYLVTVVPGNSEPTFEDLNKWVQRALDRVESAVDAPAPSLEGPV